MLAYLLLVVAHGAASLPFTEPEGNPYTIVPLDVNIGGTRSTSSNYAITASTGQRGGVGTTSSPNYQFHDGFWRPALTLACPWDCGGKKDKNVGIVDLLTLIAQWGLVGSSCDFGVGASGVGINELLELLANWGPCP